MRHLHATFATPSADSPARPLFTGVALLSIALGIGANTAIFTLVDEVLLRRLPVKDPEQLVLFNGARNHYGSNSGGNMLSFPMYEDFRDNFVDRGGGAGAAARHAGGRRNGAPAPPVFSGMFARRTVAMNVGVERPDRARAWRAGLRHLFPGARRRRGDRPRHHARTTTRSAAAARWRC